MSASHPIVAALASLGVLMSSTAAAQTAPTLTVIERPNEMVLELGPIDIPARETRSGVLDVPPRYVVVPNGGWMHGYSIELVDRTGARVTQRVLDHVYVIEPHKRELFSRDHLYLAAASGETEPLSLPRQIGYKVKKGDTLRVDAGFRGQPGRRWDGVRVRVHFPRVASSAWIGAISIYPFYLSVPTPLRADTTTIPPGRSEAYWEGHPAVRGGILGLSGHAPTYAIRFRFEDRTTNKVIWDVRPDTNAAGESQPVPIKKFVPFPAGIQPDHTYRFTVTYNNPTSSPLPVSGGWGVLGGVFVLSGGSTWPSVAKDTKDR